MSVLWRMQPGKQAGRAHFIKQQELGGNNRFSGLISPIRDFNFQNSIQVP